MTRSLPLAIGLFVLAAFVQTAPLAMGQDDVVRYAVSGIVQDDRGAPVAGATIYGWTSSPEGAYSEDKTESAADGSFTLKLGAGKGYLNANHPSYSQRGASLDVLVDGDESGLTLVLVTPPPRTAIVEGTILDAAGNPIAGATVTISQGCCYTYAEGGAVEGSSGATEPATTKPAVMPIYCCDEYDDQTFETKEDGKYRFETYPGPRQVTAQARGYAQTTVQVTAEDGRTVNADVTLEKVPPADGTLVVKVIDLATGKPLANAQVSLQNAEWGRYAWQQTGADGTAKVTTIPGWVVLNVNHYDDGPVYLEGDVAVSSDAKTIAPPPGIPGKQYYTYVKAFRLPSGETTLEVKLQPKPDPSVILTGYVVDPDAKAGVPNAYVSVWNMDTGDWGNAQTDKTGSYRLVLRPGHYTLNVWAEGHYPGAATFRIGDDETAVRVDVDAPKGQQKYAPCDGTQPDCGGGPMPLYAERSASASAGARDTDEGATAPAVKTLQEAQGPPPGADSTRAAAYSGSGGGLPEYDPADAPAPGETSAVSGAAPVPAAGALLAIAALALLAIAVRRKM